MNQPIVSIIIPVYNAEEYLDDCLDSAEKQTLSNIEIICINDGSRDRSLEILMDHKENDPRIVVIDQKNQGAAASRNTGIAVTKGRYLSFLDADDFFPDINVLELMVKKAEVNDANICGGSLLKIRNGHKYIRDAQYDRFDQEGWIDFKDFQWDYGFYRYLYRRDFVDRNHLRFHELRYYEDPPFLMDAMLCAGKFYAMKELSYAYRLFRKDYDEWSFEKTNDLAKGILYCIKTAKKNSLQKTVDFNIERINHEYLYVLERSLEQGNKELLGILNQIRNLCGKEIHPIIIYEGKSLENKDKKKGLFHKIKGLFISMEENGMKYTWNRILFHMGLKEDNDPERTMITKGK